MSREERRRANIARVECDRHRRVPGEGYVAAAVFREHIWRISHPKFLGKGLLGRHNKKQRGRRLIDVQTVCCGRGLGNGSGQRKKAQDGTNPMSCSSALQQSKTNAAGTASSAGGSALWCPRESRLLGRATERSRYYGRLTDEPARRTPSACRLRGSRRWYSLLVPYVRSCCLGTMVEGTGARSELRRKDALVSSMSWRRKAGTSACCGHSFLAH